MSNIDIYMCACVSLPLYFDDKNDQTHMQPVGEYVYVYKLPQESFSIVAHTTFNKTVSAVSCLRKALFFERPTQTI